MTGRWGGRKSPHVAKDGVAKDFQLGALSSSELSQFKKLSKDKQNEIIRLLEKIKYWERLNPDKAGEFRHKLKQLETSLGL